MYVGCCVGVFFFFKQKTAYDMRISDWSSDVCSSDLDRLVDGEALAGAGVDLRHLAVAPGAQHVLHLHRLDHRQFLARLHRLAFRDLQRHQQPRHRRQQERSEEHTSELQSLMRISYAVFCLKKKKTKKLKN